MPYIEMNTNALLTVTQRTTISKQLSQLTAELLNKSEKTVMIAFKPVEVLLFAGTADPAMLLIVKSMGLTKAQIDQLSDRLTSRITELLSIVKERIYINFEAPPRTHWACNGKAFA